MSTLLPEKPMPNPVPYNIDPEKIIALRTPKQIYKYLKSLKYPIEPLEILIHNHRRRKDPVTRQYMSATPEAIKQMIFGAAPVPIEHIKSTRISVKKQRELEQEERRKEKEYLKNRKPMRTGIDWVKAKKKWKEKFNPDLFENKYPTLDEFVTFAHDNEINIEPRT
jgi:hypothetical protein